MKGSSSLKMVARTALVLGLLAAGGCDDDPFEPGETIDESDLADLGPGIHAILSVPGLDVWMPKSETTVRLHLASVDVDGQVGSVQGELTYEVGTMELLDVSFPPGLLGAWNEVEPGRVRFAGITLEGVGAAPLLEVKVRSRRRPEASDFTVALEEVIASEGFVDMTGQVVQHEVPLLSIDDFTREQLIRK